MTRYPTKTSETSAVVRENSELSAITEQNGDGVNQLPIVARLREPWTQEQSRRPAAEHEAADTIEGLVALLTDALDYVPPFLELSERGHALLAKISGDA